MDQEKRGLVLLERPAVVEPRVQAQPRLGGSGSGAPPPYYVACGQSSHAVIGIDLGTETIRAGCFEKNAFTFIAEMPALLSLKPDGTICPGLLPDSEGQFGTVGSLLPLVGREWRLELSTGSYTAEELLGTLLLQLKLQAQRRLERPVSKAVMTVPACFTSLQRSLLSDSCALAGIELLQLINEPTAAALAHCFENNDKEGNYLIFSMGAGTSASSVFSFSNGIIEVKSTSGNSMLGGQSIDAKLIEWMMAEFQKQYGYAACLDNITLSRLRAVAKQAKLDLLMAETAHIRVPGMSISPENYGSNLGFQRARRDFLGRITRPEFISLCAPVMQEAVRHVDVVMQDSHLLEDEIHFLLLHGPSAVALRDEVKARFPRAWIICLPSNIAPSFGASLQAALLAHDLRHYVVWDVVSVPIRVDLPEGKSKQIIARGTPLPVTGYHLVDSPDATINVHVMQGDANRAGDNASLSELTINNCPPTASGDSKVEIAVHLGQDGTARYSARHVCLNVNLTVHTREGQRSPYANILPEAVAPLQNSRWLDQTRLNRLARKLGIPPAQALTILKEAGYTNGEINDGTAVERMLNRLRRRPRPAV